MNVFTVIAYYYDGAVHCTLCAEVKFGLDMNLEVNGLDAAGNAVRPIFLGEKITTSKCGSCGKKFRYAVVN